MLQRWKSGRTVRASRWISRFVVLFSDSLSPNPRGKLYSRELATKLLEADYENEKAAHIASTRRPAPRPNRISPALQNPKRMCSSTSHVEMTAQQMKPPMQIDAVEISAENVARQPAIASLNIRVGVASSSEEPDERKVFLSAAREKQPLANPEEMPSTATEIRVGSASEQRKMKRSVRHRQHTPWCKTCE